MPSLVALALAVGLATSLAAGVLGDAAERRDRVAAEWATPALVQAVEASVAASGACTCRTASGVTTCPTGATRWPASGGYRIDWSEIGPRLPQGGMLRDLLAGVAPEAEIDRGTGMVQVTLTASDAAGELLIDRMAASGGLEATKDRTGSALRIHLPPLGYDGPLSAMWRMDSSVHFPRARCAPPRPAGPVDLSHLQPVGPTNANGWTHPWK